MSVYIILNLQHLKETLPWENMQYKSQYSLSQLTAQT